MGFIITIFLIFSDLIFPIPISGNQVKELALISLKISPFILSALINYCYRKRFYYSLVTGLISSVLVWFIGLAILFGLSGGGLAR